MKQLILTLPFLFPAALVLAQQPVIADYLGRFEGTLAPVKIRQQKQLLHSSGAVLIDKLENNGYYNTVVGIKHNAYGAINNAGKVIAPFKYDEVTLEDEQDKTFPEKNYCFLIIRLNGKYGAVDTLGNVLCPPLYKEVGSLTPHLIKFKKEDAWGWLDIKTGKVLQSPKYQEVEKSYALEHAVQITQAGKVGLAAEDGSIIAAPDYTSFEYLGYEGSAYFGYTINGKSGIMDKTGKQITPAIYDQCGRGPSANLFGVTSKGKAGIVDTAGNFVQPLQYTKTEPMVNTMIVFMGNKCGVINESGKEIIPPQYDAIKALNAKGEELYGGSVIDSYGRTIDGPAYFMVTQGRYTSLFDQAGKQLLPFEYEHIAISFYHDTPYLEVIKNNKSGLLDLQGKIIFPPTYDEIRLGYSDHYFYQDDGAGADKGNYLPVINGNHLGLFNTSTGKEVLPPKYDWMQWQNPAILYLRSGDTTLLATKTGKIIRGGQQYGFYTAVDTNRIVETRYANDGRSICELSDLAGNILYTNPRWEFKEDRYSRTLMPDSLRSGHAQYNNGLLKIWGDPRDNVFVDSAGKEVVFDGYSFVGDFSEGLALAGKDLAPQHTVYGIINRQQQVILPISMDDITRLEDGILMVKKGELKGLIKKDGAMLLPVKYERIDKEYSIPYYKLYTGKLYGMADATRKEILPVVFDEIYYQERAKLFRVTKAGKMGIADMNGKMIIPAIYEELEMNENDDNIFPLLVKEGKWYFYLDKNGQPLPYRSEKKKSYND
ncbi:WG repeat-containing protein [Chitinophaga sp.]|uniref:WG repeat-containing protein n=1 Tax=Chitinophaga sp. TaxID=1869181 RepID=UPI002F92C78C